MRYAVTVTGFESLPVVVSVPWALAWILCSPAPPIPNLTGTCRPGRSW